MLFRSNIESEYKLKNKDVQVIPEGGLNKRRPLTFSGDNIYVGGSNFNIGSTKIDSIWSKPSVIDPPKH